MTLAPLRRAAPLLLALVLPLASACYSEPRPVPPPPAPPRVLSAQEAVNVSTHFARARGLVIDQTHLARLDRNARWHVELSGMGGRDRALVILDGFTGRVLRARLRGPRGEIAPGPGVAPPYQPAPPPQGAPPPPSAEPPAPQPPHPVAPAPGADDEEDGDLPPVPPPLSTPPAEGGR